MITKDKIKRIYLQRIVAPLITLPLISFIVLKFTPTIVPITTGITKYLFYFAFGYSILAGLLGYFLIFPKHLLKEKYFNDNINPDPILLRFTVISTGPSNALVILGMCLFYLKGSIELQLITSCLSIILMKLSYDRCKKIVILN